MKIYISVISHEHSELINKLECLESLSENLHIVLKSNAPNDDFIFENNKNIKWLNHSYGFGFGANNNIVYQYCIDELGMTDNDYFIVLNPDVVISDTIIESLVESMNRDQVPIATINLFKDYSKETYDYSIRRFPSLLQFVSSFLGMQNTSIIDKNVVKKPLKVDWAAGSFLAFRAGHYKMLGGFDEKYFMYCEDIDICYRSAKMNLLVTYYPQFEAIHLARHANRKVFSKHFYWHVSSVLRFLMTKVGLTKPKSILD